MTRRMLIVFLVGAGLTLIGLALFLDSNYRTNLEDAVIVASGEEPTQPSPKVPGSQPTPDHKRAGEHGRPPRATAPADPAGGDGGRDQAWRKVPEHAAPAPLLAIASYREVLGYSGPDAELRFHRFVDTLRADREGSADYLHRQLDGLSVAERLGAPGRGIAFLLGHIGHRSSIPQLSSLIEMEQDEHESGASCSRPDSPSVTKGFAAHALDMIATRYHSPDTVLPVAELLEDVLRDRDQSPHLKVSAATILLSHAENPEARARQLAEWMGEDAYLLEIDLLAHSNEVTP